MKLLISLGLLCVLACATANWCCGDKDTKVSSKVKAVTRSRTIPKTTIMYHRLKTGYRICENNTIPENNIPKGWGDGPADNTENRKKYNGLWSKLFGSRPGGTTGHKNDEYHSYCPIYTTKSRAVVGYATEYYVSAMFDDDAASCSAAQRVCCRGYAKVGDTCVDEKNAGSAASNLDYLKKLGIVG